MYLVLLITLHNFMLILRIVFFLSTFYYFKYYYIAIHFFSFSSAACASLDLQESLKKFLLLPRGKPYTYLFFYVQSLKKMNNPINSNTNYLKKSTLIPISINHTLFQVNALKFLFGVRLREKRGVSHSSNI